MQNAITINDADSLETVKIISDGWAENNLLGGGVKHNLIGGGGAWLIRSEGITINSFGGAINLIRSGDLGGDKFNQDGLAE